MAYLMQERTGSHVPWAPSQARSQIPCLRDFDDHGLCLESRSAFAVADKKSKNPGPPMDLQRHTLSYMPKSPKLPIKLSGTIGVSCQASYQRLWFELSTQPKPRTSLVQLEPRRPVGQKHQDLKLRRSNGKRGSSRNSALHERSLRVALATKHG